MKRIGILTSGGDTPGMNAAIRAVVKTGIDKGMSVMGIYHGYKGLIEGRVKQLQYSDVHNIIERGGTILRTARSMEFKEEEGQQQALKVMHAYNMDALVVVGGDGSFRGAKSLSDAGIATVGIPGTIDNDMGYTDFTIGFDTAVNNIINDIAKIRDTMRAHDRVGVIEVMGRNCGDIALWAGLAAPADITLLPEQPRSWEDATRKLAENKIKGRFTSIVVIAEGAGHADEFAQYVRERTDIDIKPVVLSYIQRGGNPTARDRVLATRLGVRAVELIAEGKSGRAVGIRKNTIYDVSLEEAVEIPDIFDVDMYRLNETLTKF